MRISILGHLNTFTGYGQHLIHLFRELGRLGVWVTVRPITESRQYGQIPDDVRRRVVWEPQPDPVELVLSPPFTKPTPGKWTAYYTMWESTRLPGMCLTMLNEANLVIVPSSWSASCFSAQGLARPIEIVNLGHDPDVFYPKPKPIKAPGYGEPGASTVRFGIAAKFANGPQRKNVGAAITAFKLAFRGNERVRFELKAFPDDPLPELRRDERIVVIREFWSDQKLAEWLSDLDCYVSASTSEGWGLIQHQACAVGTPVIAALYSGLCDFLSGPTCLPVRYRLVPAEERYRGLGLWAMPNTQDMAEQMRFVYDHTAEAHAIGAQAALAVSQLTWRQSAAELLAALRRHGAPL